MMKGLIIFILALGKSSAVPFAVRPKNQGADDKSLHLHKAINIRGGDLGPLKAKDIAQSWTIFPLIDAALSTFAPVSSMASFGLEIDKGSFPEFLTKVVGVHATGFALTNYVATSEKISIEKAIGYGILARILIAMILALSTNVKEFGIDFTKPAIGASIMLVCMYGLLTGAIDPAVCGNVVTFLMTFLGAMLLFFTRYAVKNAIGLEVEDKIVDTIFKYVGGYVLLGGLQIGMLMNDLAPTKTAGYTALGAIPLMFVFCGASSVESVWGVNIEFWAMGAIMIVAAIALGTLL